MEQRDYLKRQIEQIGIVLGGLYNRLLGRSPETGDPTVRQICDELKEKLDIDIESYLAFDTDTIMEKLQAKGFDYTLSLQLTTLLSSMADKLPADNPRKQEIRTLATELSVKVQERYATIDISLL